MRKTLIAVGLAAVGVLATQTARAVGTPAGTSISNQAYADYKDTNGNALPRVYSNEVETVVSQVRAVDVDPDTATKSGKQGTSVSFPAEITNLGNGDDIYDLTANNADGWNTTIYADLDNDGILDPEEAVLANVVTDTSSVPADGVFNVIVVVDIPGGTGNGTLSNTTLTATSQADGAVTETVTYTIDVQDAVLAATKTIVDTNTYRPGDVVTYAIRGENTGSATAEKVVVTDFIPANTTYVANSTRMGPVNGDYASAAPKTDGAGDDEVDYNITNPGQITVAWGDAPAGDSGVIYFKVTINANVAAGTSITNFAEIDYEVGGIAQPTQQSSHPHFSVEQLAGILLDPNRTGVGDPGDQVVYAFTATNSGNAADTIELTYVSTSGWTWTFWKDVNEDGIPGNDGDVLLTDSNSANGVDTGQIPAGGSIPVLAVATVPAGTADATVDTTTVTGTSAFDGTVTDPEVLTTTVTAPRLKLTKSVSPAGEQPPGTTLTYLIEIENTGTGTATTVVVADSIPAFTTYVAGSIRTGSSVAGLTSRSDDNDGDGARFDAGSDAVLTDSSALGGGGKLFVEFKVTID